MGTISVVTFPVRRELNLRHGQYRSILSFITLLLLLLLILSGTTELDFLAFLCLHSLCNHSVQVMATMPSLNLVTGRSKKANGFEIFPAKIPSQ